MTATPTTSVLWIAAALVASGAACAQPAADTGSSRPANILLVIGDDFGLDVTSRTYPGLVDDLVEQYGPAGHDHPDYGDIGGRPASTPVLEELARQGMVFTDVWAHPFPNLDFIDNMYITRNGRGKGTAYESGARVPMVVRGPGIEAGTASGEFAHAADLFSTMLELAGLEAPRHVSGADGARTVPLDAVSLAPILLGDAAAVRDPDEGYVLTESLNLMTGGTRHVGVRNATYKLVCTHGTRTADCELYDLVDDPLEEYPLDKPGGCARYASGAWTRADSRWHYCRLNEVVVEHSFF